MAEGKQRGFKSVGLHTLENSKRNLIINNSWTSWTLFWVLHPVCIFVTEASWAFQQLGLPVAKISITDDVQTATDPVLFRHLSHNPPTEVSFFAFDYREKPKRSVQPEQLDFIWLQLAEKNIVAVLQSRNECRRVQPAMLSSSMLLLWEFLLRTVQICTAYM